VTRATRREVTLRDAGQCSYVSPEGERCPARDVLELDHRHPRALGGTGDAANVRLLCKAHDRHAAEKAFGREHVERRIRLRQEKCGATTSSADQVQTVTLHEGRDNARAMRRSSFVLPAFLAAACGGRVDDRVPTSTPDASIPSDAPTLSGCEEACDRFHACAPSFEDRERCISSCTTDLPDPGRQRAYASCIQSLRCEEIQRGLSMNYGPIGECHSKASKS